MKFFKFPTNRSRLSHEQKCLFVVAFTSLLLCAIALFPEQNQAKRVKPADFIIKSFSMTISDDFKANWQVGFYIKNLVGNIFFSNYTNIYISVLYKDVLLTTSKHPPILQAYNRSFVVVDSKFSNKIDDGIGKQIVGLKRSDEAVSFSLEVRARVRVRVKVKEEKKEYYSLRVQCDKVISHFRSGEITAIVSDRIWLSSNQNLCHGSLYPKA